LGESDPTGIGPGKGAVLKNFREHTGEAPPYSVQQRDLHIFILNETSAVAAYVVVDTLIRKLKTV
jgi:hypothetical protein